ncbi:MAG: hypothetical protein M3292_07700 [Actinomycetota bacterium]|nr:hypothetical protein [Actinomycetota bacterium]
MKRLFTIGILVLAVAAMLVAPAYATSSPDDPAGFHGVGPSSVGVSPDGRVGIRGRGVLASADRPAASFYTPPALKAMGLRWQALADAQPAASFYTPAALKAMGERYEAEAQYLLTHGSNTTPDDRSGIRGTGPVSTVQPVADGGVDWGNVGIGVGSGVFALLVASGMIFAVRRSRRVAHA